MTRRKKRIRNRWFVLIALSGIAGVMPSAVCLWVHLSYEPPPVAFSGDSSAAKQTVVVPTLDTPMPKGKNVIWCGTVQLCWDGLKALPGLQLPNDTDALRRINAAKMNPADLPSNEFYTAAGWIKDGIEQKNQADMAEKFPKATPNIGSPGPEIQALAYAYLATQVKFATPYFDRDNGDVFTDSAGNKTHVSTFGMFHDGDADINGRLADQIQILYWKEKRNEREADEFALDLDSNSSPNQLILAVLPCEADLAASWKYLKNKMEHRKLGDSSQFSQHNMLVVPNVIFRVQHRFPELEKGLVTRVCQSVDFRLDKSGAVAGSEASIHAKAAGGIYGFTRPFLIVMRKRGAMEPYFVMWVDNAEMLCKQSK